MRYHGGLCNGVRGTVVKAADPKSGRYGVRLDTGGDPMALKLSNLTDYTTRWERSGIHSGVSSRWRSCVWADADMYHFIVVVGSNSLLRPPRNRARGLHRSKPFGALCPC